MRLFSKIRLFIWFSFIYSLAKCDLTGTNDNSLGRVRNKNSDEFQLSLRQQNQILTELDALPPERRQKLFDEFQKQRRDFERSRNKWLRLRDITLPGPDELSPIDEAELDSVREQIRSGSVPVVRDKRTLKFLIKSLAEILGLRWTLLKYSLVVPLINGIVTPPNASAVAAPASPTASPAKPAPPVRAPKQPVNPPPRRLPPPKRPILPPQQPPSKTAPPASAPPASRPAPPASAPPAPRPVPPATIPPNQIDPNTIRYPFRPAPTIPILNFAPLPPGVTVPYPILFQWPTIASNPVAPAPAPRAPPKGPPTQPPCAAPPPAAAPPAPPKPPVPPSRLPLPKPRPPVPRRPQPVAPTPAQGPSKTPLKLEYDHPVRIEIFNNVKAHLPASGSVYSGSPTSASIELERPTEYSENPTQTVMQAIDEQYNTESNDENRDYDYGFYTPNQLNAEDEPGSTPTQALDYYDNHQRFDETTTTVPQRYFYGSGNNENFGEATTLSNGYHYDGDWYNNDDREETTTLKEKQRFETNVYHDDYPEQAEENRAHVNIEVSNIKKAPYNQRVRKQNRKTKKILRLKPEESKLKQNWGIRPTEISHVKSARYSTSSYELLETPDIIYANKENSIKDKRLRKPSTSHFLPSKSFEFPRNATRTRTSLRGHVDNAIIPPSNAKSTPKEIIRSTGKSYSSIVKQPDYRKPSNEFRIIVPHARRRRDIFFDDAFKNFDNSFASFNKLKFENVPTSTESQFLDLNGKLIPNEEYRKQLEKDVEKYVEQYVEQQISNGVINPNKPKTTVIELKTKEGPPIKTITTTLSKKIEGDKGLLDAILEYSKEINPVSNIGELGAESGKVNPTKPSEDNRSFIEESFAGDAFSWNFKT